MSSSASRWLNASMNCWAIVLIVGAARAMGQL
jgi:hypothetical protein